MIGATGGHEAGCRRDRDEAGDGTARGADHADLAVVEIAREHPGDRCCGGRGIGDEERVGGDAVGAELGAGVEAEPAEPQEARAEDGHRDVVRLHPVAVDDALADEQRDDQGGDTGRGVDDGATGEVERARFEEPAIAPTQ